MSTVLSKDVINTDNTHVLGERIKNNWPGFDLASFDNEIAQNIPLQGLGERIQQVRKSLHNHLPEKFETSLNILLESLPPILKKDAFDSKLDLASQNGFIMISLTAFVARYGIDEYDLSMAALKEMTKRFSAEGSIRYFIKKYPKRIVKTFDCWVLDASPHVRRLVSESTRPRLPMMMSLPEFKKDPSPVIIYLEQLKNDPELFVRRSVANNLNDISKDNPDVVTELLSQWNRDKSSNIQWLIKHALRTLEKQGNSKALAILGYSENPNVDINSFELSKRKISLGDSIDMSLDMTSSSKSGENLLIDYVVFHMKANGKLTPKVFKWSKKLIESGQSIKLVKKHSVRKISTRRYYSGRHEIHVQINGRILAKAEFDLLV